MTHMASVSRESQVMEDVVEHQGRLQRARSQQRALGPPRSSAWAT